MQRHLDLRHQRRGSLAEALGAVQLLDHSPEEPLRVVPLAEEPPVERVEPLLALRLRQERDRHDGEVHRRANAEQLGDGAIAVQ